MLFQFREINLANVDGDLLGEEGLPLLVHGLLQLLPAALLPVDKGQEATLGLQQALQASHCFQRPPEVLHLVL